MVQRYTFGTEAAVSHDDGPFVSYADFYAVEAERDEMAAEVRQLKRANEGVRRQRDELAARLREAQNQWGFGNDHLGDGDVKVEWPHSDYLTDALTGPVPECEVCQEAAAHLSALMWRLDSHFGGPDISGDWHEQAMARDFLARHAEAKGGGDDE